MKLKRLMIVPVALAVAITPAIAEDTNETLGEKAAESFEKAKEATKEAGRVVVETTKKATDELVDAVTPDKDARNIDVKISGRGIDMPIQLGAGKTAFIVHNSGTETHNFEINGGNVDKKFFAGVAPNDTKVLHVDLKPGTYQVQCPVEGHADKMFKQTITVK